MPNTALDAALQRIAGEPAVAAGGATAPLPKQSFKDFLGNYETAANITQTTPAFDPMAAQQAAFEAKMAAVAGGTTAPVVPAAAPVTAAAAPVVAAASKEPAMISYKDLYNRQVTDEYDRQNASIAKQLEELQASGLYKPEQLSGIKPYSYPDLSKRNWGSAGQQMVANPYATAAAPAASPAAAAKPAPAKPVNPGPRAPWQASQQYWRDLATYNAGGK